MIYRNDCQHHFTDYGYRDFCVFCGGEMKESTVCQACGQDRGKGCWTRPYGQERVFLCPDCYANMEKAKAHPYSALADKLAKLITGYAANRKLARA